MMDRYASLTEIAERIAALAQRDARYLIAIAGPPGAGKSSAAATLAIQLNQAIERCAVVPMDGFHFDNAVLKNRGLLAQKGSPTSFDTAGLRSMLQRLRTDDEVTIPLFDRREDFSRNAAFVVGCHHRILLVEGNYLLLNREPWTSMRPLYDISIMIDASWTTLERRLIARWLEHGLAADDAVARAHGNDLTNADDVLNNSVHADFILTTDDAG